jgi:DNA-binding transcriptional ArsR family regulator
MPKRAKRPKMVVQRESADKLAVALGHPLRAWCLAKLNEEKACAADLAKRSGEPRNVVSYHFKVLRELGCIELVEEKPVRGTHAKVYRGIRRMVLDHGDWDGLGPECRMGISDKALEETFDRGQHALEAGTFDKRLDRVIANYKLSLDDEGWANGVEILRDAHARLEQVEPKSINRTPDPSERSRFTISLLGYESPSPAHDCSVKLENQGMSKRAKRPKKSRGESTDKLEVALGHPLRAWCLAKLNETSASGADLARLSGEPRNTVNYHLRVLEKNKCIELIEEKPVRGSTAKVFAATIRVMVDHEDWERLSLKTRTGISIKAFGETHERVQQARDAKTIDRRLDRIIANYKPRLDEQGWAETVEILRQAHDRFEDLEGESNTRTPDPSRRSQFTFSLLGYESP